MPVEAARGSQITSAERKRTRLSQTTLAAMGAFGQQGELIGDATRRRYVLPGPEQK